MTPLEQKIRTRLALGELILFRDFMEAALYDEEFGYYAAHADRIGRGGDFYTSSSISRHFGELLAVQVERTWRALGSPERFSVIEVGAGTGHLAFDLISALKRDKPEVFAAMEYVVCERSPALRAMQQVRLSSLGANAVWTELDSLVADPRDGLLFSNELVDAFPVHRLRVAGGDVRESFVAERGGKLVEVWAEPTKPEAFDEFIETSGMILQEGHEFEISLDAVAWLRQAASALRRGHVLTIDYGDLADHLSMEAQGTVRCFHRHTVNAEYFARIGKQDMTADANFSALVAYGNQFGLKTERLDRQADYLIGLGLLDKLEAVTKLEGDTVASLKQRLALKHFLVPGGFGDHFKALLQSKGFDGSIESEVE